MDAALPATDFSVACSCASMLARSSPAASLSASASASAAAAAFSAALAACSLKAGSLDAHLYVRGQHDIALHSAIS